LIRSVRSGLLLAALFAWACAPAVRPRIPEGEDYLFPSARAGEMNAEEAKKVEAAWQDVLAGHALAAERDFQKILAKHPGLVPAQAGLAFAQLRGARLDTAARSFEAVLARRPDYLPALVGAGSVAARRGDPEAALEYFRRAQAADPDDKTARRRLAEIKLRVTERRVAAARTALEAGEAEAAIAEYRRALDAAPELGGLRIDLANLLLDRDDAAGAVAILEADPGQDRQVLLRLGEVQAGRGEFGRALEAYRRILSRDPRDAEALRRAFEVRQSFELQQMPEEYRRIFSAARITRADLAALLAVKVTLLTRLASGDPQVAVDISGSWARDHILKVLGLDLMEVYPNHTFQPGAIVRRGDLARAVGRVLDLAKWPAAPGPLLKDMSESNLFHDAAVRVVAAGLMDLTPDGSFEPWRPISGSDALAVVENLVRLVGP